MLEALDAIGDVVRAQPLLVLGCAIVLAVVLAVVLGALERRRSRRSAERARRDEDAWRKRNE